MTDAECDAMCREWLEETRKWSLEETTENFTCYPLYWNEAICFTRNPLEAIPSCAIGEDECLWYFYAEK